MNSRTVRRLLAVGGLLIAAVAISSIVLLVTPLVTPALVGTLGFMGLAFLIEIVLLLSLGGKTSATRDYFFNLPVLGIGGALIILEALWALSSLVLQPLPFVPILVGQIALLALFAILALSALGGKSMAREANARVEARNASSHALEISLKNLAGRARDPGLKKKVSALAEEAGYSRPRSLELEPELQRQLGVLDSSIAAADLAGADRATLSIRQLLLERNNR